MSSAPVRRVLVTGAAGLLGGAVARRLVQAPGVDVVATDVVAVDIPGAVLVARDIRDGLGDVLLTQGIDTIVHHAFVIQQSHRPAAAHEVNVDATARLVDDARAAGVATVVYPSSTTTYGAWPGTGFHTEDEPLRPLPGFAYSAHKAEVETLLGDAARSGGPAAAVLRACIVLAPRAVNFITASLALPVMPVCAGADPPMQFVHLDDYVAAVEAVLVAARPGTWNVAGSGTVSWRALIEIAGSRPLPVPEGVLRRLVDVTWSLHLQDRSDSSGLPLTRYPWLASTERITRELGWSPRFTSLQAVESWAGGLDRPSPRRRRRRAAGEGPPD